MQMAALAPAAGLMGPITIASSIAGLAAPIMQGIADRQALQAQAEQANINSYIGKTRAMQSDTVARQGMESELGTARAAISANQQGANVGTFEMLRELRDTRQRERRISTGAHLQQSRDFATEARNASRASNWAIPIGIARGSTSLLDLYQMGQGARKNGPTP